MVDVGPIKIVIDSEQVGDLIEYFKKKTKSPNEAIIIMLGALTAINMVEQKMSHQEFSELIYEALSSAKIRDKSKTMN